jgi:TonB family protein
MKNQREFRVTMIDNASLLERLANELRFLVYELRLAWTALKHDPIGFTRRMILVSCLQLQRPTKSTSLAALATAMLIVLSAILAIVLIGNRSTKNDLGGSETDERASVIEFLPNDNASKEDKGVGAGSKAGRVGFAVGGGEGSRVKPKKSSGGGTGGQRDPLPAQLGKPPQPSEIAAPIPKFPPVQKQALPVAGIDIDPALWKNLPLAVYGDPRSKSSAPSNGPGDLGGMGTGNGTGIGEGIKGSGFGPGQDGNIGGGPKGPGCCGPGGGQGNKPEEPDHIYPAPQVTERARVIAKPEPQYTEEARRGGITGSVVLRVVFSRTGEVINIRALQTLPFGLTERAIAAARLIRFRPATKDGRPVNVYMQLEYNFNLY